ncbi:lipase family protein [Rhodanobacter ginsengiterrae]|uniref:lipase family protein n=1 Tax=Rhodanobacter ginsengiterrae TaxID=2008451 RepID=UPI003CEC6F38
MAISTDDYARMAADSYKSWPDGHAVDGTDFEVYKTLQNTTSGYYGAIYRNKITGELVVAHRGTEFDDNGTGTDILRDLVEADGQMALQRINQQIDDARHLVEIALDLAKHSSPSGGPVSVTVTGHSLGGSLAQVTAFEYGLYGETFNAYGAAGQYGTPAGGSQGGFKVHAQHNQ